MVAALLSSAASTLSQVGCAAAEMGNKPGPATTTMEQQRLARLHGAESGPDESELEVELPPPMRVMDEPLTAATTATVTAATTATVTASTNGGEDTTWPGPPPAGPGALVLGSTVAAAQHVLGALAGHHPSRGSCLSLASTEPSTAHLASEIENIVKEKMEQHEGNIRTGEAPDDCLSPPPSAPLSPPLQDFPYGGDDGSSSVNSPDEHPHSTAARKFGFVVSELVETERCYVRDLSDIVDGYMAEMSALDHRMPEDLQHGKDKIVFGNIAAIYEWHRDFFSKNLEECLKAHEKIGPVFIRSENKFQTYIKYCQNKPKSEYIVSEHFEYFEEMKQKLGHKLQLSDLLIKPVQRLMKYQLLMRDLHKYSVRAGLEEQAASLAKALEIMTVLPRDADHMMTVGRLQDFEGNIMAQGKLLHYGPLLVSEGDHTAPFRPRDLVAFLFEQRIIFSECKKRTTAFSSEEYFCKSHLQMNKLALDENIDPTDPTKFLLRSTDPRKLSIAFVCQGEDPEDHHTWTSQIRHLLKTQRDFLMAIQSPIAYQKEQTKHLSDASRATVVWEPVGLRGRRISKDVRIEELTSVPRLDLEKLLPHAVQPDGDTSTPITVLEVGSPRTPAEVGSSRTPAEVGSPRTPAEVGRRPSDVAGPDRRSGASTPTQATAAYASTCREESLDTAAQKTSSETTNLATGSASESSLCPVTAPCLSLTGATPPQHRWSAGECSPATQSPSLVHRVIKTHACSSPHSPRSLLDGFRSSLRPWSRADPDNIQLPDSRGGTLSVSAGTYVQVLQGYTALREDEISVSRGEGVQVVLSSSRGFLIHRPATSASPAAEGWVPPCVLQPPVPSPVSPTSPYLPNLSSPSGSSSSSPSHAYPNTGFPAPSSSSSSSSTKKSWIKFRKPSFSKREAKAAAALRREDLDKSRLGSLDGGGGDRNSGGSGSFGGDLFSVSTCSDISISDRLSCGDSSLEAAGGFRILLDDPTCECVVVGDGGDALLRLAAPLRPVVLPAPGLPLTLTLRVCGAGAAAATVSWFGPAGELNSDARYEQQHLRDGTVALHLDTCASADLGRYTCVVTAVDHVATRQLRCSATVTLASHAEHATS